MLRAREQILDAAAELVASGGLSAVTMASVARRSAVAKATVYNHFRDRDDLLQALLAFEGERLLAACAGVPDADRLHIAARWLSESTVIAGLRRFDPATVLSVADRAAAEPRVHETVRRWCTEDDDPERALRWLVSFAVVPDESGQPPALLDTTP